MLMIIDDVEQLKMQTESLQRQVKRLRATQILLKKLINLIKSWKNSKHF